MRFDESIDSLQIPQDVIEISASLELKPSRIKGRWEVSQEKLSEMNSLHPYDTISSRIASAVLRASHVEINNVCELEHVIQGQFKEDVDLAEWCWRDDSQDSTNCRGPQMFDEIALTLRKLGDRREEKVHIQELVDRIPYIPW